MLLVILVCSGPMLILLLLLVGRPVLLAPLLTQPLAPLSVEPSLGLQIRVVAPGFVPTLSGHAAATAASAWREGHRFSTPQDSLMWLDSVGCG